MIYKLKKINEKDLELLDKIDDPSKLIKKLILLSTNCSNPQYNRMSLPEIDHLLKEINKLNGFEE